MASRCAAIPVLALLLALPGAGAQAQSALERSPNLSGGWVGSPGTLHFNFLHRFQAGDPPTRKVGNAPTFLLAYSFPARTVAGVQYATNSDLVAGIPNEWEIFGRFAPLTVAGGAPVDVGLTLAYNHSAESADGELSVAVPAGPLRLLAAARAFSDGFASGESRFALGGGARLRLSEFVALAGDVTRLAEPESGEDTAWSAGIQLAIPYTPHTLSLHAANTNTSTLQGASRGGGETRYGFELTIPLTLARYVPRARARPSADVAAEEGPPPTALGEVERNTVLVVIQDLAYGMTRIVVPPGSRVVWVNRDELAHTATADDGSWDSGLLGPGESWGRVFAEVGEFPFTCTPHPFMTGVVRVEER